MHLKSFSAALGWALFCLASACEGSAVTGSPIPSDPDQRAAAIAESSPKVLKNFKWLNDQAQRIHDPKMRADALEILNHPRFHVVEERKSQEAQIKEKLLQAHLMDGSGEIFPKSAPMSFLAAPASPWRLHHTYPGGLVYHTATNLRIALAIADTYQAVYGFNLDRDVLRLAPIWHDYAKTMTIQWHRDGSATVDEGLIAGTARHHILAIAEALYRGYPSSFIITLASAHQPATPHAGLDQLLGFLRAASLIAGKSYEQAGLTQDGSALLTSPPLESFVHHLSDHDWVATQVSLEKVTAKLASSTLWEQDEILSRSGDLDLYENEFSVP